MQVSRLILTLVLSCVSVGAMALNQDQAVSYALLHSPLWAQAQRDQHISVLQTSNARSAFLPSVDVTSQHQYTGGNSSSSLDGAHSSLSLNLAETVYDNGVQRTVLQKAKLYQQYQAIALQKAKAELILNVKNAYLDLSLQQALNQIAQSHLKLLKQQYQKTKAAFKQGLRPEQDVTRFEADVRHAEVAALAAKQRMQQAKQQLLSVIAVPLSETINCSFEGLKQIPKVNLKQQVPELSDFYDARLSVLQQQMDKLDVSLAKRKYWPQAAITAGASYGSLSQSGVLTAFHEGHRSDWQVGIELKANLIDFGKRKRDVSIAEQQRLRSADTLRAGLLSVRQAMLVLMDELARDQQSLSVSKRLLAVAKKNHAVIERDYREGKSTYLDLTTSLSELQNAQRQYMTDGFALAKDANRYAFYRGKSHEAYTS